MNEPTLIGTHKGYEMFASGISYNCPSLKLYGYQSDVALKRAISAKVKTKTKTVTSLTSFQDY